MRGDEPRRLFRQQSQYRHERQDAHPHSRGHCPACGADLVGVQLEPGQTTCPFCGAGLLSPATGQPMSPEPLHLPRGSVRSLTTLLVLLPVVGLLLQGRPVPGYALSLLLTLIGYYFALQRHRYAEPAPLVAPPFAEEEGGAPEALDRPAPPLHLPRGAMQGLLVVGLVVAGLAAYEHGLLGRPEHAEFFLLVAGLAVGRVYARATAAATHTPGMVALRHAAATLVVAAALGLAVLLVAGWHREVPYLALALAAAITFYFGSRA
jgi:hypothetical protein